MNSREPSGRLELLEDNDSRVPSEDNEETTKPLGKKGKSVGFPKMFRFWGRRSDSEEKKAISELQRKGIRRYEYMVLHRATSGFSERYLIGREGFSNVYKGVLEGYQEVAIKVLPRVEWSNTHQFYMTEIEVVSEMRHPNVVQLLGWCHEAGHMALVLEFMPNGSLADHLQLHEKKKEDLPCLPWKVRYWRIAMGLALALQYLQEGLEQCVVHRDVKPSNILLDSDFNPKLSDFELATHVNQESSTRTMGTFGYMAPEYAAYNEVSKALDVYSFGVVALQITTGRIAVERLNDDGDTLVHLPSWVNELYKTGRIMEAVDPNLGDEFDEREVERLLMVGLWCTQDEPKSRPLIKRILQLLNFEVPMSSYFFSKVGCGNPLEFSQEMSDSDVHENHSSPKRTEEEPDLFAPGVDIDATTKSITDSDTFEIIETYLKEREDFFKLEEETSLLATGADIDATTKNTTDRDTFENIEAGCDQSSEPDRDSYFQDDGAALASSPEHTMFDIGLPPSRSGSAAWMESNRTDHHHHVLKAFVHGLHEMMRSGENLPRFDEALEKIRIRTAALVDMVGPLLDDWNTLAQLVLRYLKERDEFFKSYGDDASLADTAITLLSLDEGMRRCARTIKEDRGFLKYYEERRACAHRRCSSLEAELGEARRTLSLIEDEITALEARITQSLSLLQKRRRHHAILKQHHEVLSEISSFTC